MDTVPEEIAKLILLESDLDSVVFALSDKRLQKIIQQPSVYNEIGRRNGLILENDSFKDYKQFVDVVYSKALVRGCRHYFDPFTCLQRALAVSDISYADKILTYLKTHVPAIVRNLRKNLYVAKYAFKSYASMIWFKKNIYDEKSGYDDTLTFGLHYGTVDILELAIQYGTVDIVKVIVFGDVFPKITRLRAFKKNLLLTAAISSNNLDMLDFVFHHLTTMNFWTEDIDEEWKINWKKHYTVAHQMDYNNSVSFLDLLEGSPKISMDEVINRFTAIPLNLTYYQNSAAIDKIRRMIENNAGRTIKNLCIDLSSTSNALEILSTVLSVIDVNEKVRNALLDSCVELIKNGALYVANYLVEYVGFNPTSIDDLFNRKYKQMVISTASPILMKWFRINGSNKSLYVIDLDERLLEAIDKSRSIRDYDTNRVGESAYIATHHINVSEKNNAAIIKAIKEVIKIVKEDAYKYDAHDYTNYLSTLRSVVRHPSFNPLINYNGIIDALGGVNSKLSLLLFGDDPRVPTKERSELVNVHSQKLSIEDRYWKLVSVYPKLRDEKFRRYYFMGYDRLVQELKVQEIPYIPYMNHLAIAVYLTWKDVDMLKGLVPVSTINWMKGLNL